MNNDLYYKYYPINSYTFNALATNTLWMGHPTSFNDPLDSLLSFKTSRDAEFIKFCYEKTKGTDKEWSVIFYLRLRGHKEVKTHLWEFLRILEDECNLTQQEIRTYLAEFFKDDEIPLFAYDLSKNLGLCCFTKDPKHMLMWAHYASAHQGICVGYSLNPTDELSILEVDYQSRGQVLDLDSLSPEKIGEGLRDQVRTKQKDWHYEKEFRLIGQIANKSISIPGKIEEVVFGYRISESNKDTIKCILKSSNPNASFFNAKLFEAQRIMMKMPEVKLSKEDWDRILSNKLPSNPP